MVKRITFRHPEPAPVPGRIWPVFIPFAGCPYRCVFCAQDKQTGRGEQDLEQVLKTLEADLDSVLAEGHGPYEIAFYGGTFTALPSPWPERFIGLAQRYRERGLITRIRCSTRPDRVDAQNLEYLHALGLDMVELGIQSFDDTVLRQSGRGYTGNTGRSACALVKEEGLDLGIQLLPGLPGDREGVFQKDVRIATDLRPGVARIYPCLVIEGTPLGSQWEKGNYTPWELDRAKQELADALPVLWEAGIRVIRLGLPPEGTLAEHILAGPWHPALGQSARGLALFSIIHHHISALDWQPNLMDVPRRYQGELLGHAKELAEAYADLGLNKSNIRYGSEDQFVLSSEG